MGGVVAQLVGRRRVPLRALVLTGCFFPPARNGRGLARSLGDYAAHRVAYVRGPRPPRGRRGRARVRTRARAARPPGARPAGAVRRRARRHADLLIVHARDDHHVPVDFAQAALAAHPGWSGAILAHGGHHVHVDFPENWLAAVSPWLDST